MPDQTIKLPNNEQALFDSFNTIVAIAKLSFPSKPPYNNESSYPIIPAFIFYKKYSGEHHCIRLGGCLPVISVDEMFFPFLLQPVLDIYDFSISLLSGRCIWESEYYLYFHCVVTFKQAKNNWSLPIGADAVNIDGHFYIQLFHHTTNKNSEMIYKDRFLNPSFLNYCGNRKLKASFCYLTNISRAKKIFDTLPLLKDDGSGVISCFQSDHGVIMRIVDLVIDNRVLDVAIPFLISTDLIQPSPAICHIETQNHKEWLELMFINIYRCPCSGFKLEENVTYKGKKHWIIRPKNTKEFRTNDPIQIAHGEDMMSLQSLVNETYTPSAYDEF